MPDPFPKYPRISHLAPGPGVSADDLILDAPSRKRLLDIPVIVEEKLDGANVAVWFESGGPAVATRGGVDTVDRGGQRGRLKAWAAGNADALREALGERLVLYGEWLLRRHSVPYERLPGPLVGLDIYDRVEDAFLDLARSDAVLGATSIPVPPRRFQGRLGTLDATIALLGTSAFGPARAEGVVLRASRAEDGRLLAKVIDPSWARVSDAAWSEVVVSNLVVS